MISTVLVIITSYVVIIVALTILRDHRAVSTVLRDPGSSMVSQLLVKSRVKGRMIEEEDVSPLNVDIGYVGFESMNAPVLPGSELYHLIADNRPVMRIYVTPNDRILIAAMDVPGVSHLPHETHGVVHRHDPVDPESIQIVGEEYGVGTEDDESAEYKIFTAMMLNASLLSPGGVCLGSIYAYVMPRAIGLLARCYVPMATDTRRISVTE